MTSKTSCLMMALLLGVFSARVASAAETVTLTARATQAGVAVYSSPVTLNAGDSAQVVYTHPASANYAVAEVVKDASTTYLTTLVSGPPGPNGTPSPTVLQPTVA